MPDTEWIETGQVVSDSGFKCDTYAKSDTGEGSDEEAGWKLQVD